MKRIFNDQFLVFSLIIILFGGCETGSRIKKRDTTMNNDKKTVIYQVFTRLFGNTNTNNKTWGTLEENGVGKFSDFTPKALQEIRDLGVTHIWYTGVPHHALVTDYTDYGISQDDPDVVKGRAGSPYAVKDYYNVNPDLADDPNKRLEEFEALIDRTHNAGLKLLIDIVPNHVARFYEGKSSPEGVVPFGAQDDPTKEYDRDNDFYYLPGEEFKVPEFEEGFKPLGGERHPMSDGKFEEYPAKWTGNGARKAQPHIYDWYETVKINYGVRPDGSLDFTPLPDDYAGKNYKAHAEFWKSQDVPKTWVKFKEIAYYWLDKGVDGFRFDMAEMVPVSFWSYLNSAIKMKNPDAMLLAEVYNPALYREYLHKGKMDYLYDKVEFYDSLKHIMKGYGWTDHMPVVVDGLKDIEHHMLHFLENHDEQRIASPDFAGDARLGKPAMTVSATMTTSPTMIYFGQEVGEAGREHAGFGRPTRTSIFDYVGVPAHQRWMNEGKFDGGQLTKEEASLRDFYKRLLNFTISSSALMGSYQDIHYYNKDHTEGYNHRLLSYVRWADDEKLVIIANFDSTESYTISLKLPPQIISKWELEEGKYRLNEQLYGVKNPVLTVKGDSASIPLRLKPLESLILKL